MVGTQPLTSQIFADAIYQCNKGREAVLIRGSDPVIEQLPGSCQIFGHRTKKLCIPAHVWSSFGLVSSVISAPCCKSRAMPLHSVSAIQRYRARRKITSLLHFSNKCTLFSSHASWQSSSPSQRSFETYSTAENAPHVCRMQVSKTDFISVTYLKISAPTAWPENLSAGYRTI